MEKITSIVKIEQNFKEGNYHRSLRRKPVPKNQNGLKHIVLGLNLYFTSTIFFEALKSPASIL